MIPGPLLVIGLGAIAAFFGGKLLFRKDTEIENRRKAVMKSAFMLDENGSEILRDAAINYAVGDYSGVIHEAKVIGALLSKPHLMQAEIDHTLERVLDKQLQRPEVADKVKAKLDAFFAGKAINTAPTTTTTTTSVAK